MKRIDGKYAVDGKFVDRDAEKGIPGTQTKAEWFNDVQEEIANTIEKSGQTLDGNNDMQLFSAIQRIGAMCRSKVEFDAEREANKAKYAGSGFVEWGKHRDNGNNELSVNQGLFQSTYTKDHAEYAFMGCNNSLKVGTSKTDFPVCVADGVVIEVNQKRGSYLNQIKFPPAPDGTKSYDSATGEVIDHITALSDKYPDADGKPTAAADKNEAVSRCFEGLVKNGDFRNGTDGWDAINDKNINGIGSSVSVENGVFTGKSSLDSNLISSSALTTVAGINYLVEVKGLITNQNWTLRLGGQYHIDEVQPMQPTRTDVSFIISSGGYTHFHIAGGTHSFEFSCESISVRPVTSAPILTRQDLAFLESFHEDTSEKGILLPFGNVQYVATEWNGIPLKKLTDLGVGQGYIAFGEWDADTIGYGVKISEMTFAQLSKFCADPKNNVYFDSATGKLIQVRYRIRVVEGLGDDWETPTTVTDDAPSNIRRMGYTTSVLNNVLKARGTLTEFTDLGDHVNSFVVWNAAATSRTVDKIIGQGFIRSQEDADNLAYEGKCFAMPICLRQTLNQGAYHPVFNPEGTSKWWISTSGNAGNWYQLTSNKPNSTASCFKVNVGNLPTPVGGVCGGIYGGGVASSFSGRPTSFPDAYYDAIYAHQIKDLRLSARKQDVNKLREDAMRKAVAGEMRGWGKVPFTKALVNVPAANNSVIGGVRVWRFDGNILNLPATDILYETCGCVVDATGTPHKIWQASLASSNNQSYLYTNILGSEPNPSLSACNIMVGTYLTPQNDTLAWTDLIGSPENISKCFPNGVQGMWIPVVPDGTQKTVYSSRKFTKAGTRIFTGDDGATWVSSPDWVGQGGGDTVRNVLAEGLLTEERVTICQYPTLSNFTEPANNSAVVGDVGDVYYTDDHRIHLGNRILPSLTNNIATHNTGGKRSGDLTVLDSGIIGDTLVPDINYPTKHYQVPLIAPQNNSPAVKVLSTITEKNGLLYPQYHGNGLKYDVGTKINVTPATPFTCAIGDVVVCTGFTNTVFDNLHIKMTSAYKDFSWPINTWDNCQVNMITGKIYSANGSVWPGGVIYFNNVSDWGDDSIIPIINGEGTKTDLNGNTVKTFCHHGMMPIGIASN